MKFSTEDAASADSRQEAGGGDYLMTGAGMAIITAFDLFGASEGKAHKLELQAVTWTNSEGVQKVHSENIFHSPGPYSKDRARDEKNIEIRMGNLATACGLLMPDDIRYYAKEGIEVEFDWSVIVGRPVFVELEKQKKKNETTGKLEDTPYHRIAKFGNAIYCITDPQVAKFKWPMSQQVFNQHAEAVGAWRSNPDKIIVAPAIQGVKILSGGSGSTQQTQQPAENPLAGSNPLASDNPLDDSAPF